MVDDKLADNWHDIENALEDAVSIAWDGCHKIYILLDEDQHRQMIEYGYEQLLRIDAIGQVKAYEILKEWYDCSCGLRFVNSVRTVEGDPNKGYTSLIAQFEDEDEDDDIYS